MGLEGFAKKIEIRSQFLPLQHVAGLLAGHVKQEKMAGHENKKFPHKMILTIEKNKN